MAAAHRYLAELAHRQGPLTCYNTSLSPWQVKYIVFFVILV